MTDEENNIENDETNQFGEKIVDSEKHCSVISPNNVLRVFIRRNFKAAYREASLVITLIPRLLQNVI